MPAQRIAFTTRIYSGYFFMGLITLVLGVIAFIGLSTLNRQFNLQNELSSSLKHATNLGFYAAEMQSSAETYLRVGQPQAAESVDIAYHSSLNELSNLSALDSEISEPIVKRIDAHLKTFQKAFKTAKTQRSRRQKLVKTSIPDITNSWGTLIEAYQKQAISAGSLAISNEIWRDLLIIEKHMGQYFESLIPTELTLVDENYQRVMGLIDDLFILESSPPQVARLNTIRDSLVKGYSTFNEGVQITRNYLFLINVVMAAESYEIKYLADKLQDEFRLALNSTQDQSSSILSSLTQQLIALSILFILMTIVIGIIVGRSIERPIAVLRDVFNRLSRGERDINIPTFHSKDEIAALAASAEAFRQANDDTKILLDKYQALSTQLDEKVKQRTKELERANRRLKDLSVKDGLTQIYNRRFLDASLIENFNRARRSSIPLSVIILDIDYFKAYNDTYGHQQGDTCIQHVTQAMSHVFHRSTDTVARYGGEEFVALLFDTPASAAQALAEKLRKEIESKQIPHRSSPLGHVTVSLGCCTWTPDSEFTNGEEILNQADKALYQSKESGRNKLSVCPKTPPSE
jgi:diguanylate cyclase (GGDEF)-like protein